MIFHIVVRWVFCSLLGAYEHAKVRANFHARHRLYKHMSFRYPDVDVMARWIRRSKHLITYIIREYLVRPPTPTTMLTAFGPSAGLRQHADFWDPEHTIVGRCVYPDVPLG